MWWDRHLSALKKETDQIAKIQVWDRWRQSKVGSDAHAPNDVDSDLVHLMATPLHGALMWIPHRPGSWMFDEVDLEIYYISMLQDYLST